MPNPNLPIGGQFNVYNGARYVPVIMGEWSATVNYEPLMIVTSEGNSYTSKTFVPAGTPVSNTTYWTKTGDYNAQVEQYRNEVVQLSKQVNGAPMITPNTKFLFIGGGYPAKDFDGSIINTIVKTLGLKADQYESFVNTAYSLQASNPQNSYDYLINQSNIIPDYVVIFGDDQPKPNTNTDPFNTAVTNLAVDIESMWPNAITYEFMTTTPPWDIALKYNYILKNMAFTWNLFGYNDATGLNDIGAYHTAKYISNCIKGCDRYAFRRAIPVTYNNQPATIIVTRSNLYRTVDFSTPFNVTLPPNKTLLFPVNAFTQTADIAGDIFDKDGHRAYGILHVDTGGIYIQPYAASNITFNGLEFRSLR